MLSTEFIPTSPSDEDFLKNNASSNNKTSTGNSNESASTISTTKFTTNPEGVKFVPQPPVQFYYSLQVKQKEI